MVADVTIRDYYLQFKHKAKEELDECRKETDETSSAFKKTCRAIKSGEKDIAKLGIVLGEYKEWTDKEYDEKEGLYKAAMKLVRQAAGKDKPLALQVAKFCVQLKKLDACKKKLEAAEAKSAMKFTKYQKYVMGYYSEVQKCVLCGMGYKFSYGIGTFSIELRRSKSKKLILDYKATNDRKKEMMARGVKLYDDKEAAWYAARNIPYDGADYRVFRPNGSYYVFPFENSKVFGKRKPIFQRSEYVSHKYRGMSHQQLADEFCPNEEDIYGMQVDIKVKLNMLLYKYPNKGLNYVRQSKRKKRRC